MANVQDKLDTFHALQSLPERIAKEETWDAIDDHLGINRTDDGTRNVELVQDGGPQISVKTFQSGLMGRLMQPRLDWFTFGISDEDLMKQRDVRMWISKGVQACQSLLSNSNVFTAMYDFFGEWGMLGTAPLYRYWDDANEREVFHIQPVRGVYLGEDKDHEVDTVYRYFMLTAQQMVQRFGEDKVDAEVLKAYNKAEERFKKFKVLHTVDPNRNYDPRRGDSKSKRYSSCYIDVDHELEMSESGYAVMPYAVGRNEKPPGEVYGRGPGFRALSDIKGLYAYVKSDITGAQFMVEPVIGVPEEMKGVKWVPRGRYYFEDAGREPHAVDHKIELRAGLDREARKQAIIDQHFLVPQFTMMQRLGDMRGDKATLGHVARIEEEIAVHLGPQVAGFNQDVMDKIIDGLFQDAWEQGRIPPPPRVLVESQKGKRLETIYLGPLAQAQRRFTEQEPYRRAMANVAALIQMDPSGRTLAILDNYDFDHITREMSKADGLPEESLVEEKVVAKLRQARAKQAEEQKQLAAMETMGKPGMTKAIEPGSIIEKMGKAREATGAPA